MSIDTTNEIDSPSPDPEQTSSQCLPDQEWNSLQRRIAKRSQDLHAKSIFGKAAKGAGVYRWGVAAARGAACGELFHLLSRAACDQGKRLDTTQFDIDAAVDSFFDRVDCLDGPTPLEAAESVLWAASLPTLAGRIEQAKWWRLLRALERLREMILRRGKADGPAQLMIAGELGLTLAWRLAELPGCRDMQSSSFGAVALWCDQGEDAIAAATTGGRQVRLILASVDRCRRILKKTCKLRLSDHQLETAEALATWVAAMTLPGGRTAFSAAQRSDLKDDCQPGGLLSRAKKYDPESLEPAIAAALGASQTGGRLAWEVSLPETLHHQPDARIAVMIPDWDVRRGRVHLDYSQADVRVEAYAGRAQVIGGDWQTLIQVDGVEQQASDGWVEVCEFSDDDVHYLEIEQPWTGGVTLQRQCLLIRDDRCLMLADSVFPTSSFHEPTQSIAYSSRIPLSNSIQLESEAETRELFLRDGRRRGLVVPLSANEWQIGPTDANIQATEDQHLLLSSQGTGRLYVPLWFDFQQRRFDRQRTWRQLTVADRLNICDRSEAVGYRVQVGSEQWVVYRSMGEPSCRTVLGKHLDSTFFASRFDPSDGSHDELINVEDNEQHDD